MRSRTVFLVFLLASGLVSAQQPITEPEYRNQYTILVGDRLVALEHQTATTDTQSRRNFVITPNTKVFESIPQTASPVRVPPTTHFYVKMGTGGVDPSTLIHLRPLTTGKKDRQIPIVTYKQSLIPFGGVKHERAGDDSLPVTIQKYGNGSFEIIPQSPLPAGEYAFVTGHDAQCFGVDSDLTEPKVGSDAQSAGGRSAAPAPPPAPVWKFSPAQKPDAYTEVSQASTTGMAEGNGKRSPAILSVSCTVKHFTSGAPDAGYIETSLQLRRDLINFDTSPLVCEGDGAEGAPYLYTQIGTGAEEKSTLCFDAEMPADPRQLIPFGLGFDISKIKNLSQVAGSPLIVKFRSQPGGKDDVVARFQIPANSTDVLPMIDPCTKLIEAEKQRVHDAIVVSCPVLPNKNLDSMDVLVGPTQKKLPSDPDNTIGISWVLPKVTKAHPVRPKLTLSCSYTNKDSPNGQKQVPEKKLLPIPASATFCSIGNGEPACSK